MRTNEMLVDCVFRLTLPRCRAHTHTIMEMQRNTRSTSKLNMKLTSHVVAIPITHSQHATHRLISLHRRTHGSECKQRQPVPMPLSAQAFGSVRRWNVNTQKKIWIDCVYRWMPEIHEETIKSDQKSRLHRNKSGKKYMCCAAEMEWMSNIWSKQNIKSWSELASPAYCTSVRACLPFARLSDFFFFCNAFIQPHCVITTTRKTEKLKWKRLNIDSTNRSQENEKKSNVMLFFVLRTERLRWLKYTKLTEIGFGQNLFNSRALRAWYRKGHAKFFAARSTKFFYYVIVSFVVQPHVCV